MRFTCMGYLDHARSNAMSDEERQAHITQCVRYDEGLRAKGHLAEGGCLGDVASARTVRLKDGAPQVAEGHFTGTTKEVLGAILYLEARDMEQAVELLCKHPGLQTGLFEIRKAIQPKKSGGGPEAEVRAMLAAWSEALERKDVDGMMAHYLADATLFDAIPPYKVVGRDSIAGAWRCCLPCFPASFRSEYRDLTVQVDANIAMVFGLHRVEAINEPDHPCGQTWMRVSLGLRKVDGAWKVMHEHFSVPFNPLDDRTWKITDPEKLDAPDYAAVSSTAQ